MNLRTIGFYGKGNTELKKNIQKQLEASLRTPKLEATQQIYTVMLD